MTPLTALVRAFYCLETVLLRQKDLLIDRLSSWYRNEMYGIRTHDVLCCHSNETPNNYSARELSPGGA